MILAASTEPTHLNWTFIFTMWAIYTPFLLIPLYFIWRDRRKHRLNRRDIQTKTKLAVHMPLDFLKPEPRRLKEIPLGDTVWVDFTEVTVDKAGRTFVDMDARVREEPFGSSIKVRLEKQGAVVTLPTSKRFEYTPRRLLSRLTTTYLPVIEIRQEDYDTWHAQPLKEREK